jgi:SAM-dependent methyltransferase
VWPFPADFTERVDNPMETDELSDECATRIDKHLTSFIQKDCVLLEIGSETDSVLPTDASLGMTQRYQLVEDSFTGAFRLPFDTASFDAIHVSSGVQYVNDPKDVFKEVWRVLRPGGTCFGNNYYYSISIVKSVTRLKI